MWLLAVAGEPVNALKAQIVNAAKATVLLMPIGMPPNFVEPLADDTRSGGMSTR